MRAPHIFFLFLSQTRLANETIRKKEPLYTSVNRYILGSAPPQKLDIQILARDIGRTRNRRKSAIRGHLHSYTHVDLGVAFLIWSWGLI